VNADVATHVIPGKTTNVTYKCNDPFVIDPKGPQFSTCDQLTGQWTDIPICICADPPVPANAQIASNANFNVTYKCKDPFVIDSYGPQYSNCDQLTGMWTDLPICMCSDPLVPANADVVQRLPYSVRFRCAFGYHLTGVDIVTCNEKGIWNQLPSCKFN
jgi:Sushi repeat (SCR repeat)